MGMPPAMSTNVAQIKRLELNANLRPITSAEKPQRAAPTRRPIWDARDTPAICLLGLPNSWVTAGWAMDWQTTRS